jgi:hypothetical protein
VNEQSIIQAMQRIAVDIRDGRRSPQYGANNIHFLAANSGAYGTRRLDLPRVTVYGSQFEQMADALERNRDSVERRSQYEVLIMDAVAALLSGKSMPEWRADARGELHRSVEE